MRLQERTGGEGVGGGAGGSSHAAQEGGRGHSSSPRSFLPPKVANICPEVIKQFSHTKRVGSYLLGKTLGEGSFAKVKEGLHTLTGEKVAVKVIDKKKAREDVYVRKNLRREGKLLQMVRHRHVVRLFEVMETENSYYLVTELCNGGDLMEHICTKKRLDEKETRKYIRQILSAVDYLHKLGILHRDLKVENLLLDENKNVKIIDFGLSNSVEVTHNPGGVTVFHEFCVTQCGSPAYAAPELLGNNKYGPNVDIWSVGVNMFAMLTGSLPFTVEPFNIKALHKKMLKCDMNPTPEHLTKNCRDLLKKFLNPDPDYRITVREAMKHPWVTEGFHKAVEQAPFPNRLSQEQLNPEIMHHMIHQLDFRSSDTARLVTGNIPNSATATYFLLSQRLCRYEMEVALQARIARAMQNAQQSPSQDDSGYDITGSDVIELTPMTDKDDFQSHTKKSTEWNMPTQEPKVIEMTMSPRRLPDDRPTPPRPAGRSRQYRQEDAVAGSHHERSPRRRLPVPREVSPRRDDASPRRAQLARRPSVDPPSPRGSPRRGTTHSNATTRRASTEPQRRASLLPRSASQETEGSTVAPSDVVLPDLEPEVGEDSVTTPESGQVIHLPHEGQKVAERVGTARGSTRGRGGGKDQMNLPVVTHLGRRRSFEYPASPETMRHRLGVAGVKSPSGRGAGGNNSNSAMPREGDRLSPCVNSAQRTLSATRSGDCDYRNSAQQNASSHSATSSVSRHNGGGGGGVRAPMIHHADDQTAVRSDQPAGGGRAEWRSARPARSAYPHSTPHTDATRAAAADAISVPRKLVIDVNQYDRYARATGRIRTIASGDEPVYIGGHRRLINLMYPAQTQLQQHHRKPGHIVPRKSPQLPRTPMQQSHGVQHDLLGVTGERAVGSGRGIVRDTLPSGQLPVRHGEAVSQHLTEMPRDLRATSPVSCARSRTPSPAYFKSPAQTQKVELPAISPTPVSGANAKLHIEDLDK